MVSDMRGILPLFGTHLPDIADARRRFLAPRGRQIPERDQLWAALAEAPKEYRRHVSPCDKRPFGIDMTATLPYISNSMFRVHLKEKALLMPPKLLAEIDYRTLESPNFGGTVSGTVPSNGTAHGVVVWFEAILFQDIGMTNAPGAPDMLYGQSFFPLRHPVPVSENDTVRIDLSAHLIGEAYVWQWRTRIRSGEAYGRVKADFRQSTFYAQPYASESLRTRASSYIPQLGVEGRIDRIALELMDGTASLETIAEHLAEIYPEEFRTPGQALDRVASLSARYTVRKRP